MSSLSIFVVALAYVWGLMGLGRGREGVGKGRGGKNAHTTTKPMIVHLARIALDLVVLGLAFDYLEAVARDDDVGGAGPAGPFLTVGAVAEGRDHGFARVFVLDGRAHAGAFCHFE